MGPQLIDLGVGSTSEHEINRVLFDGLPFLDLFACAGIVGTVIYCEDQSIILVHKLISFDQFWH
jgi:hypothetical protein